MNLLRKLYNRIKEALTPKAPPSRTVRNMQAKYVAMRVHHTYTLGYDHQHCMQLNQRQRRKRRRQAGR